MAIRVSIDGHVAEGSAEEIAILLRSLRSSSSRSHGDINPVAGSNEDGMTRDFARLVLTRRPLSPAQRKLFKMLSKRAPGWLPSSEIMEEMNFNGNQYGGLFGAIGRRVAKTVGFQKGFTLFDWRWDEGREEHDCRLVVEALEAFRELES